MPEQSLILAPFSLDLASEASSIHHRTLLGQWHQHQGYNSKSFPQKTIDFYADCLIRHLSKDGVALRWYEDGKLNEIRFTELHAAVVECAECWHGNGIEPGSRVAILCASPLRRTIALLAGFKLGLKISLIPVTGSLLLKQHLQRLAPDYLHVDSAYQSWVEEGSPCKAINRQLHRTLDIGDERSYERDEIVLRLLDPYSESEDSVLELRAGYVFERLLHDALLILELERGYLYAGMSSISNGVAPFPELSTLLVGATFFFIEPADWRRHALDLMQRSVDVVSIPAQARTALAESGAKVEAGLWRRWIRNPIESLDYQSWRDFGTLTGLDEVPHADLLYTSQMAGISLGQPWSTDFLNMGLYTPTATPYHLGDLVNPEAPSALAHGRLCAIALVGEEAVVSPTPFMLTKFDGSFRFVGLYPPGRQGKAYPISSVLELLATPDAHHAVIEKPGSEGVESKTYFILTAFNDARTEEELGLLIQSRLGEAALPDEILGVPLFPRLKLNGDVDVDWVSRLYFRGELALRGNRDFYRAMGAFKHLVYQRLGKRPQ